ncbi:PhzF family phenazine biosynthesis protein [Flavobacterium ranwuense]|uniref:PhzF family phenazine biosynthesis protein n=1 Tax=Flavobacterium ranwuense TaxID=2541725 RepID=A0ABY2DSQ8_9FLAO|nr:PhzF family phenazine biosynthesis protein [Flavobacterium ranwuense]
MHTYIVDSFTDKPFQGNPAGVCLIENDLNDNQMLLIAKELGLSETAFVKKIEGEDLFSIRFFSPKMEMTLCGHATLASSKVLFERDKNLNKIHFKNIQNLDLIIRKEGEEIIMEFPIYDTVSSSVPSELLWALGLTSYINCECNQEYNILILEIEDPKTLSELRPDFEALYKSHDSINGVLVTSSSNKANFDFESRYFWPWSGTNEDPVTGGSHTFLAKYWSKRLGKTKMSSFQCSERSGFMEVELLNNSKMTIRSMAQIVFIGQLKI